MKKLTLLVSLLLTAILLFQNCKKEQNNTIDSESEVIYTREKNYKPSESVLDNHITSIIKLNKKSKETQSLIRILKQKKIDDKLDINSIKLLFVDNSSAKIFNIKYYDSNKWLVVYETKGNYIFQNVEKNKRNGLTHLSATDLSNILLYSLDLNNENKVGNVKIGKGNILMGAIVKNGNNTKSYSDSCPGSTSSFGDCMLCAIHECWDSWACAVAMGVEPELIFGTFATVCAVAQL